MNESRPYDSTYVSAGANSLPTYDQSVLTYSRGEITSVMPSTVDWALGPVITVIGYGFAQPAGSGFYHPRCTFERDGNFHFATNATIVSDTIARCEYPGSYAPDTPEARQTVELILTFNFPPGKSLNIYGGWMTVVISSYTVYAGPDQPLNAISELGGSVVSVTITHGKGDASGAFVDHVSGKVSSFDVACAFGTICPISARYNESETFECVSPAATQSASAAIPLFVTLFASSMLTSFTKWNALTSTGDIHYSAHPVVSAIWPPTVFSVATSVPTFQIVGSNFPSLSPRCQLDEKDVGATGLTLSEFAVIQPILVDPYRVSGRYMWITTCCVWVIPLCRVMCTSWSEMTYMLAVSCPLALSVPCTRGMVAHPPRVQDFFQATEYRCTSLRMDSARSTTQTPATG